MHEIDEAIGAARRLMNAGRRGVFVTVISTSGSTYRGKGARAVLGDDGSTLGMISGGCVEKDIAAQLAQWLDDPRPRLVTWDSTSPSDIVFGFGLGCRGTIELLVEPFDAQHPPQLVQAFAWRGREPVVWVTELEGRELMVETIRPPRSVLVFGGGRDVPPIVELGQRMSWSMTQISPAKIHPEKVGSTVDVESFDSAVVMTHNFLHDATLLELLLPSAVPYIGVLGPRKRGEELLDHLGSSFRQYAGRLHSPIGLDLGGETPEEIALAIVAEIQSVFAGRGAHPLRERHTAIHVGLS